MRRKKLVIQGFTNCDFSVKWELDYCYFSFNSTANYHSQITHVFSIISLFLHYSLPYLNRVCAMNIRTCPNVRIIYRSGSLRTCLKNNPTVWLGYRLVSAALWPSLVSNCVRICRVIIVASLTKIYP